MRVYATFIGRVRSGWAMHLAPLVPALGVTAIAKHRTCLEQLGIARPQLEKSRDGAR
jgi:hypothetical protein